MVMGLTETMRSERAVKAHTAEGEKYPYLIGMNT